MTTMIEAKTKSYKLSTDYAAGSFVYLGDAVHTIDAGADHPDAEFRAPVVVNALDIVEIKVKPDISERFGQFTAVLRNGATSDFVGVRSYTETLRMVATAHTMGVSPGF